MNTRGCVSHATRRKAVVAVILVQMLALSATRISVGQRFLSDEGTAEFTSRVPLHSFTGTSHALTGVVNLADSTVDFFLDLETLETGIGKRDKDMRLTLETEKYPFAEFFGKLTTPLDLELREAQAARAEGTFTIHGVSRAVSATGTLKPTGSGLRLEAEWELNLEDYDIVPPKLLIVKVDEVQQIRISVLLTSDNL